ncbi:tetratricopeptide repeat protein [Dongia sedimenti]|uniref:Tetratricopeptide repeat protein n=1 Tax=Dongia sedimenti TaxID=3064282 RepID=A0ABU0YNK9_9PROT|nr:tetratricopeptide repeat protein [Rhodospirillaceae bacterium R-7]
MPRDVLSLLLFSFAILWTASVEMAVAETPPAAKPDPVLEEMKPCETGADPAARAVACTQLITGGTLRGKALGAAYVFRGKAQAQRREMKAAILDFSEALKVDPQATDALYNRGAAYALMGQTNSALADFAHLLDLAPNDADTLFYRALIYVNQGKTEAAVKDLSAVLGQRPDDAISRLQRAGLLIALGRNEDAISDLNALLKKEPTALDALYNRGRAEMLKGDNAAAADDFETVMQSRSNNPYAALRLTITRGKAGNGKMDMAPLDAAAKAYPPEQWPLPIVAFYQGNLSEADLVAAARVRDAAATANLVAETQYYLGQWALLQDDRKAARRHFEAAVASKAGAGNLEFIDAGLELKRLK